jgi:hypothetical protein
MNYCSPVEPFHQAAGGKESFSVLWRHPVSLSGE